MPIKKLALLAKKRGALLADKNVSLADFLSNYAQSLALEELTLSSYKLSSLNLPGLTGLKSIALKFIDGLEALNDFSSYLLLERLSLLNCLELKNINLRQLSSLRELSISVLLLPEIDLSNSTQLTKFEINRCKKTRIKGIGSCQALTELSIAERNNLEDVPFNQFSQLRKLEINRIEKLQTLPDIAACSFLDTLVIRNCSFLNALKLPPLKYLKKLVLSNLNMLESIGALYKQCPNLEVLEIEDCGKLKEIDLSGLIHLKELKIQSVKIEELKTLTDCVSLEQLTIVRVDKINTVPFAGLRKLQYAYIFSFDIHELKDIHQCEQMSELRILCHRVKNINLTSFKQLKSYETGPGDITELQSLPDENILEELTIYGYKKNTIALPHLKHLKRLMLKYCHALTYLPDLSVCDAIEHLIITKCNKLRVTDLSKLTQLTRLEIDRNPQVRIEGIGACHALEELTLSGCSSPLSIDFSSLIHLIRLKITSCSISNHFVLRHCRQLQKIDMRKLTLKVSPSMHNLPQLKDVRMSALS